MFTSIVPPKEIERGKREEAERRAEAAKLGLTLEQFAKLQEQRKRLGKELRRSRRGEVASALKGERK